MNLLAQIKIAPGEGFRGLGTGPLTNVTGGGVSALSSVISMIIGVMTVVAIIWAVFVIMTGAISIISSGGDKQKLETARKRITNGILGLVIVFVSLLIVELIGYILGVKDILNLQNLFSAITGGTGGAGGGSPGGGSGPLPN